MIKLYDMEDVAKALGYSRRTIQDNPTKFHMYKIGSEWRISEQDLLKYIDECKKKTDNAIRLASKEVKKCRSKNVAKSGISISNRQTAEELGDLLARQTKRKR